ncbi:hypothetical protein [Winogradskyella jejuensis]|uniref:Uncharacterized protein n=1 Tax=Winogradskyella jejuensis TaxID=1089305 RepID=A0A1M5ST12_9FLAO|nr:hypothetical protein [Winogradskyella jejuensis]SHH41428.1 hypothetical protein SAMN05444148_1955 [Winogradskyella jejuensis]
MKRQFILLLVFALVLNSCKDSKKEVQKLDTEDQQTIKKQLAKVTEENFDIRNDSLIFKSATIENFDKDGNSIDVYWIGKKRDTVLRFYRKYDYNMKLIGAEYYEEDDIEPSRDTVYTDMEGNRVEASLNTDNQIRWKSTIHQDVNGNDVLMAYSNGKGEYRGFDSLYYDNKNRVIKGFYENSKGKRYSTKTYRYLKTDDYDNWIERHMLKNDTLSQKQLRTLVYY